MHFNLPAKVPREAAAETRGNGAKRRRASWGRKREKAAAVEENAYRQIVQAVMENRLRPGTKLDEDRLAKIFRISRTRLRKVISLLVNEHIVVHQLNYGAFVSRPSIKEARDVFETRHGIEEYLVRLLCEKKPPADLSQLEVFVRQESKVYASGESGTNRLSGDFHIILAELTGNEVLVALMSQLVTRTTLIQALYGPPHICLVHEHAAIVEALSVQDTRRAEALMKEHLWAVERSCDLTERDDEAVDLAEIFPLELRGASIRY